MTDRTPFDRRRSRWIAFDVFFFAGDLGADLLERFGPAGVTVFLAFLLACKRNHVEGQFSYQSDADALAQLGLTGMPLLDLDGNEWTLDTLWTFTGERKVTRRTHRGRVQNVIATRWERWQNKAKSQPGHKQTPTSEPENTGEIEDDSDARHLHLQDTDNDTDKTPTTALALVPATPARQDDVAAVFDAWKAATGKTDRTVLDPKRRRVIVAALKAYPVQDVVDAVNGWKHSPFHCGQNDHRKVYNDLTLLLRDSEKIEQFRDLARGTAPTGRSTPKAWQALNGLANIEDTGVTYR